MVFSVFEIMVRVIRFTACKSRIKNSWAAFLIKENTSAIFAGNTPIEFTALYRRIGTRTEYAASIEIFGRASFKGTIFYERI